MALAAPGSATIMALPSGRSCRRVSLWQWSDLFCDAITISGSGSSERCDIHAGAFRFDIANHEADIMEGPMTHGSMSIVYGSLDQ